MQVLIYSILGLLWLSEGVFHTSRTAPLSLRGVKASTSRQLLEESPICLLVFSG